MNFKLLKSRKNRQVLIVVTVSFFIFSTWIFLAADIQFALSAVSVSLLLLLFIFLELGKPGWYYYVASDGIRIKRSFKKYFISFNDIDSVKEISRSQAGKLVNKIRSRKGKSGSGLNYQVELGRLIGFSSVPVTGAPVKDIYKNTDSRKNYIDKFVLIRKKNGGSYILSPADTAGLVKECSKNIIQ